MKIEDKNCVNGYKMRALTHLFIPLPEWREGSVERNAIYVPGLFILILYVRRSL